MPSTDVLSVFVLTKDRKGALPYNKAKKISSKIQALIRRRHRLFRQKLVVYQGRIVKVFCGGFCCETFLIVFVCAKSLFV